ncbi:hypothetical protein G6F43_010973 [Rhizopus delemar]|nr:hypothetical protein G6F43_010973 [Rhizopus delemar]
MYSPQTPERGNVGSSTPLKALTPIVDAIKSAQSKATKDFESFYGNLMSRLTPRTTTGRIDKRTPEITQRIRMTVDKKKFENNKSSLTPLFERHSLREVEYQNPFYEDSESEATTADDIEFDTVDDNDMLDRRINDRIDSNKHCSLFDKLKQETKRIERLQSNISAIKRQSSLLAQGSLDSDYDEQRQEISTTNIPLSAKPNTPNYYTPQPPTNTYLTPPQSADKYRQSDSVDYNDNNGKSKIDNNSLLNGLSNARLRSAEIIRTPGGSRTCNRFWKEIHGLNAKKDTISPKVTSRVEKLSPKRVTKRLWDDNDDTFWTTECSMTKNSSSFNQKLMRMKRLENEQERVDKSIKRISLFDEVNEREKKKIIPTMNPLVLQELKAKYQAKHTEDSS